MMNLRKGYALLLVGMMVMSGLVAFLSAPVAADYDAGDDVGLGYDNAWQEPSTMPADDTVRLIYNWDGINTRPYCLGDLDAWIEFEIINLDTDAGDDMEQTEVTLSCADGAITEIIGDDTDLDATDDDLGTINAGGTNSADARFWFDVAPDATLGQHAINIHVDYEKPTGTNQDVDIPAYIYISSIFDDTATPDEHEELNDFDETTAGEAATDNGRFEAGDQFVEGGLLLHNYGPALTDLSVTLALDAATTDTYVDVVGDYFECEIPDGIPAAGEDTAIWRLNIADGTPPDEYACTATITYRRNDMDITEGTRDIQMEVDYNYRTEYPVPNDQPYSENQATATGVTITDDGETDNVSRQEEGTETASTGTSSDVYGDGELWSSGEEPESLDDAVWIMLPVGLAVALIVMVFTIKFKPN